MKALVINGPNLNMLGIREPGIYGTDSYEALVSICQDSADELGFDRIEVFQSNHEGAIVDRIQEAYGRVDGIVINPAAYTHTSIAILDALKAVGIPAVEVHISAVEEIGLTNYGDLTLIACSTVKFARFVTALLNDLVGLLEIFADNGITGPLNSMCQCPLSE